MSLRLWWLRVVGWTDTAIASPTCVDDQPAGTRRAMYHRRPKTPAAPAA